MLVRLLLFSLLLLGPTSAWGQLSLPFIEAGGDLNMNGNDVVNCSGGPGTCTSGSGGGVSRLPDCAVATINENQVCADIGEGNALYICTTNPECVAGAGLVALPYAEIDDLASVTTGDSSPVGTCGSGGPPCVHIRESGEGFFSLYGTVNGELFKLFSSEQNIILTSDTWTAGSITDGVQEAINLCAIGADAESCKILVDNPPANIQATITRNVIHGDTLSGLVLMGHGGIPKNDTGDEGITIQWAGAAGGTMFDFKGINTGRLDNLTIRTHDGNGGAEAGRIFDMAGSNLGVAPNISHIWVFDNVHFRGNTTRTSFGYVWWGHDSDGGETNGSGTATAFTSTTLSDSGKAWGVNEWLNGCTAENDEECLIICTNGPCLGQIHPIVSNTATQITIAAPGWLPGALPNTTSTYRIQAINAVNGAQQGGPGSANCTFCDSEYSDQLDFIEVRQGSCRNMFACGVIANNQSLLNRVVNHEAAQWSGPGAWLIYGGEINFIESYGGVSLAGAGPYARAYQTDTNGIVAPLNMKILGGHFELGVSTTGVVNWEAAADSSYGVTINGANVEIQADATPSNPAGNIEWLRIVNSGHWSVDNVRVAHSSSTFGVDHEITNQVDGFANGHWGSNNRFRDGFANIGATVTNQRPFAPMDVASSSCSSQFALDRNLNLTFDAGECFGTQLTAVPFSGVNFDTTTDNNTCMPAWFGSAGTLFSCATASANLGNGFLLPGSYGVLRNVRCMVQSLTGDAVGDSIAVTPRFRDGTSATDTAALTIPTGAADNSYHTSTLNQVFSHIPGWLTLRLVATDGDNSITDLDLACIASVVTE
jgi:hypothetical protein